MEKLNGLEKSFKTKFVSLILLIFGFCISVFPASPGALDFSFGNAGRITNAISVSASGADIIVQPDGKILASGTVNLGVAGNSFFVARYNVNNTLDTTFGTSGVAIVDFGNESGGGLIKLQPDGKILLGGAITVTSSTDRDLVVARLNSDGSLDTGFGTNGKVTISFSLNSTENFGNIDVASDGKIIVAGTFEGVDCSIARLNTNGTLDATFDSDGRRIIDLGATNQNCRAAVQTDNKIFVGSADTSISAIAVARLNTSGTFDTTFDTDGIAKISFTSFVFFRAIHIQSNGRILVSGQSGLSSNSDSCFLARFNTNGTADSSFDGDGKLEISLAPMRTESFTDFVVHPNGDITALLSAQSDSGLVRFSPSGALRTNFGYGGIFKNPNIGTVALALQDDEKILSVGSQNSALLMTRHTNNIQPTQSSDFDGDGFSDFAIFRPSTANWFILRSSDNTTQILSFGSIGDIPMDGDFDGDGRNDLAIHRPGLAQWWIQRSSNGEVFAAPFGLSSDNPVPGDYDKDGKTDVAIFRPSSGEWFVLRSSSGNASFFGFQFGTNGDIPINGKGF